MTVFLERVVTSMAWGREGVWWVFSTLTTSLRGSTTQTNPEIWGGERGGGRGRGREGGGGDIWYCTHRGSTCTMYTQYQNIHNTHTHT